MASMKYENEVGLDLKSVLLIWGYKCRCYKTYTVIKIPLKIRNYIIAQCLYLFGRPWCNLFKGLFRFVVPRHLR